MARSIVLGYDGSACSREALDVAVDLARDEPGSRILVVHGQPLYHVFAGGPAGAVITTADTENYREHTEAAIRSLLAEAEQLVTEAGVPVETRLEWDVPFAALLDVAEREAADMIVVGNHGRGALGAVLLGSTPYKLLHHSTLPVVVVPHRRRDQG